MDEASGVKVSMHEAPGNTVKQWVASCVMCASRVPKLAATFLAVNTEERLVMVKLPETPEAVKVNIEGETESPPIFSGTFVILSRLEKLLLEQRKRSEDPSLFVLQTSGEVMMCSGA